MLGSISKFLSNRYELLFGREVSGPESFGVWRDNRPLCPRFLGAGHGRTKEVATPDRAPEPSRCCASTRSACMRTSASPRGALLFAAFPDACHSLELIDVH